MAVDVLTASGLGVVSRLGVRRRKDYFSRGGIDVAGAEGVFGNDMARRAGKGLMRDTQAAVHRVSPDSRHRVRGLTVDGLRWASRWIRLRAVTEIACRLPARMARLAAFFGPAAEEGLAMASCAGFWPLRVEVSAVGRLGEIAWRVDVAADEGDLAVDVTLGIEDLPLGVDDALMALMTRR